MLIWVSRDEFFAIKLFKISWNVSTDKTTKSNGLTNDFHTYVEKNIVDVPNNSGKDTRNPENKLKVTPVRSA